MRPRVRERWAWISNSRQGTAFNRTDQAFNFCHPEWTLVRKGSALVSFSGTRNYFEGRPELHARLSFRLRGASALSHIPVVPPAKAGSRLFDEPTQHSGQKMACVLG